MKPVERFGPEHVEINRFVDGAVTLLRHEKPEEFNPESCKPGPVEAHLKIVRDGKTIFEMAVPFTLILEHPDPYVLCKFNLEDL